jgi:crotonobetainyl-CoA:carnitine CoA-transferase CaiB-like acyl-CoA transferase
MSRLPLADMRIIAIEQYGAGPWATLQLSDLGADVIKVEDPSQGGDVGRYVPPYQAAEDSLFFEALNRGKRSVSLDLRHPEGQRALHHLVATADALFCNLRGDQPARLGLTYDDLRAVNPHIVCCSLSGFGRTGPRRAQGSYDYVIQGLAGWMSVTGQPGQPPTRAGVSVVDFSSGYVAALAIVAGVWQARRDGHGTDCDVSLFETALAQLNYVATWVTTAGWEPRRLTDGAHPTIVPFQNFATADGWLVVACAKEKFWRRLCEVAGRHDLADDPRFATFARRDRHREALLAELYPIFRSATTSRWIDELTAAGVPCGRINTIPEALEDEQSRARGVIQHVDHPRLGAVRHVASAVHVGTRHRPLEPAPQRGEHTHEVLRELVGANEVERLERAGAFGPHQPDSVGR